MDQLISWPNWQTWNKTQAQRDFHLTTTFYQVNVAYGNSCRSLWLCWLRLPVPPTARCFSCHLLSVPDVLPKTQAKSPWATLFTKFYSLDFNWYVFSLRKGDYLWCKALSKWGKVWLKITNLPPIRHQMSTSPNPPPPNHEIRFFMDSRFDYLKSAHLQNPRIEPSHG